MPDFAPLAASVSRIALIAAALRGESSAWPAAFDAADAAAFVDTACDHGVAPLLNAQWRRKRPPSSWPDALRRSCHADAVAKAAHELMRRAEVTRVLMALAASGVEALLMKGTALAYSHYANPALRPRADCDLLVVPSARETAARVINDLGYRRVSGPAGHYVGYQLELRLDDPLGVAHTLDLHWRISNAQAFAWLFHFDELATESVPVEALGPNARRLGDRHALALALLHRAGNNVYVEPGFGDRLIWLYDFRVLVDAMTDDELARFVRLTGEKRIAAIAIDGLRRCADCFPSPRLDALVAALEASPGAASGAQHLRAGRLGREWREIRAIPTSGGRLAYLGTRLLPGSDYMHERFPETPGRTLPILHAQRWLERLGLRFLPRKR